MVFHRHSPFTFTNMSTRSFQMIDGCTATTHIAYAMSEVATIYPISPASDMGEMADKWGTEERQNIFGQTMIVREMESEAGAAGAMHGALSGGALTTTFTASQGLMLMIPNMYKISGELLPGVFHVTTRSLAAHALSIFGDHQDIMACRQTGLAFLASNSVQECMDLSLVAHLSAIESSLPICHFFDGIRTSSEMQSVHMIDYHDLQPLVNWDKLTEFRQRAMNPEHPNMRGTAQNPDVYFQNREAANPYYLALPDIVQNYMNRIQALTGRAYRLFDYVGDPQAEYVIVAMGSSCEVIEETIQYLLTQSYRIGLIKVRLYRPFATEAFLQSIPASTKVLCVLDRTKEPGSQGEPLFQDVCTALYPEPKRIVIMGGRYGLSSKEFRPNMVKAVYDEMIKPHPKTHFTIGIDDDVTHLSLPIGELLDTTPEETIQCKFFGIGSDGTVGGTKQIARVIGDHTGLYAQAYFEYSAKKSEGYTISQLRFGKNHIQSSYQITHADYISCHKSSYIHKFDVLDVIKDHGIFVLNSSWTKDDMDHQLPAHIKRTIATKKLKFYNINADRLAQDLGLGVRINMIMMTVFLKLVRVMDFEQSITLLKEDIRQIYAKEGDSVIQDNFNVMDQTINALTEIKYSEKWCNAEDKPSTTHQKPLPDFIENVAKPILTLKGDDIPVSAFSPDGFIPLGTSAYEKRRIASHIPQWDPDSCVECCECSFVCAHAAIRPVLATQEELIGAPSSFETKPIEDEPALNQFRFRIQVYPEDCLGCNSCINVCPGKALSPEPLENVLDDQIANLRFAQEHITIKDEFIPRNSIRGSQLQQPLLEFSGACAACGETPYVKLLTQLFGERLIIANATGCSSIWGASMPSAPYTKNRHGHGPAWGNSLFEDNAEYGYGILTAIKHRRQKLSELINQLIANKDKPTDILSACTTWNKVQDDPILSYATGQTLIKLIQEQERESLYDDILARADLLGKKSVWAIGGDGWAYDIGFGGLDHVLASGESVKVLVLDTECYSNTGGQTSKATPLGAVAKFSSAGKRTNKKELGRMMMVYGDIYVASICLGTDKQQAINALMEAEAYEGPAIVIAYCPCINHGIKAGMGMDIAEEAHAVKTGYWPLYRYNPDLIKDGKNPFIIDYQSPNGELFNFLDGEDRYESLKDTFPEISQKLRSGLQDFCQETFNTLNNESK